jgi:hypothetical protein
MPSSQFPAQRVSTHSTGVLSNNTGGALGVWDRITLDSVNVRSRIGSEVDPDCTHLGNQQADVECFSIQQNFWIADSKGNMVLWVQNVVQLAEMAGQLFGTYSFFVWNSTNPLHPQFCFPFSFYDAICQAPVFTRPVQLPHDFTFYATITRIDGGYTVNLSNDLATQSWSIPRPVQCPCFIATLRQKPLSWGYFPFEFVVVGLDNGATAVFGNGTRGSVSPAMVQLTDGNWHLASLNTFQCEMYPSCLSQSSTGESSENLRWDNDSGKLYWSAGDSDQGNYIGQIYAEAVQPPISPHPPIETILYLEIDSGQLVDLTIFDNDDRATGYDSSSGLFVQNIPNSFVTSSSDVHIVIIDPNGPYRLVLTPLGSTTFRLLVLKEFNINATRSTTTLDGNINTLVTQQYVIDSQTMALNPSLSYAPLLPVIGIALLWITLLAGIGVWFKKRRVSGGKRYSE